MVACIEECGRAADYYCRNERLFYCAQCSDVRHEKKAFNSHNVLELCAICKIKVAELRCKDCGDKVMLRDAQVPEVADADGRKAFVEFLLNSGVCVLDKGHRTPLRDILIAYEDTVGTNDMVHILNDDTLFTKANSEWVVTYLTTTRMPNMNTPWKTTTGQMMVDNLRLLAKEI